MKGKFYKKLPLLFASLWLFACAGCKATETNENDSIQEENSFSEYVDFSVEVEKGRDIRVLQLTDTQIIDVAQMREGRDGANEEDWVTENMTKGCFQYIQQAVDSYQPDLILLTGDLIYGEFDDNGTVLLRLINFMEDLQIPWAPVFGNHDNESKRGVDWQCRQLENAEHCLFQQRALTGNGNYSVGLVQDEKLVRVFYMLDSNGCGNMSAESLANGHSTKTVGFGYDQIEWYEKSIRRIKEEYPDVKFSMACHIQPVVFQDVLTGYGYHERENPLVDIDALTDKKEGDFGLIRQPLKTPWDTDYVVWTSIKDYGIDSLFVGHEHCNSASVVYDGVRLAYGLKTGLYDRANYRYASGTIMHSYYWDTSSDPIVGGTVIDVAPNGEIDSYHLYHDHTKTVNVSSKYKDTLYATFVADGVVVENVPFERGATTLSAPPVPEKEGVQGAWESFTLADKDITVYATY